MGAKEIVRFSIHFLSVRACRWEPSLKLSRLQFLVSTCFKWEREFKTENIPLILLTHMILMQKKITRLLLGHSFRSKNVQVEILMERVKPLVGECFVFENRAASMFLPASDIRGLSRTRHRTKSSVFFTPIAHHK